MKTTRFYKLTILALLLLNMATLFFLWRGAKHHGPPERNQLVEHLALEGDVRAKVLLLQDDHFKRKGQLVDRSRKMHEQLLTYFSHPEKNDSKVVSKKIDQIVENQREIEQMTFDYFKEVSSYCNSEQKELLSELIRDVLKHAGGPPPKKD